MRVIAGSAKGRKIETLSGLDTRPTLDRVKEALFGSIQFDLPGSNVLDLFAGSGGLGLEAASRGAKLVVLNDYSAAAAAIIRKNAAALQLNSIISIMQLDYREAIHRLSSSDMRFDFVFLDAPYDSGFAVDAAQRLFSAGLIRPNGRIFIEHAAGEQQKDVSGVMRTHRVRKFGKCAVTEMERDG